MKIRKVKVECEVVKSSNFNSVRCGLSVVCDLTEQERPEEVIDVVYEQLQKKCVKLIDKAIEDMKTQKG